MSVRYILLVNCPKNVDIETVSYRLSLIKHVSVLILCQNLLILSRVDETRNFNQTTDFVGPVDFGTSGHNEQYNSRLSGRPMPGIGDERLPPVEFRPDFDSLQQHVSAKSTYEAYIAGGFTSSYKALGRLHSSHFFLGSCSVVS